jgi:sorbitol-6-phosphate 2-dehydrogenase
VPAEGGRLAGRVAIVTGAAQGLGLGIARRLDAEGGRVILADEDDTVIATAADIGKDAVGQVCDVADSSAVDRLVEEIAGRWGQLDIMVANAGIGGGGPIAEASDEAFRRIIAVNLEGVFYCCRAAARAMVPRGTGVILTIGSIFGRDTPAGAGAYGASKAGVVALTRALARELGPAGIRVNCISPGNMATEMHWRALERRAAAEGTSLAAVRDGLRASIPLRRHGTGDDVGALAAFLASDDAAYITGQTINVDGGYQPR